MTSTNGEEATLYNEHLRMTHYFCSAVVILNLFHQKQQNTGVTKKATVVVRCIFPLLQSDVDCVVRHWAFGPHPRRPRKTTTSLINYFRWTPQGFGARAEERVAAGESAHGPRDCNVWRDSHRSKGVWSLLRICSRSLCWLTPSTPLLAVAKVCQPCGETCALG